MPITKVRTPSGEIVQVSHPEGATDDEIIAYAKANAQPQPKEQAAPKAAQMPETLRAMSNLAAGGIRGAGSIGATLLASPAELASALPHLEPWRHQAAGSMGEFSEVGASMGSSQHGDPPPQPIIPPPSVTPMRPP